MTVNYKSLFKMPFKSQLQEKLREKLNESELQLLPQGYQAIGEIVILNLKLELLKHKIDIGKAVLEILPRFKTVCNKTGEIKGEFREPQIEVIAGVNNTVAIVKESGCLFKFDVAKIMFAKGNLNERVRIAKQVKPGEIVVDMFAGIGYFSVPIGKLAKPKKVYSIEKNPISYKYLKENLILNKITSVQAINGDCRVEVDNLVTRGVNADRIVMGYLPPPMEFVDWALKIVKKGVIHYECLLNEDSDLRKKEVDEILKKIQEKATKQGKKIKLISENYVKDYRPHVGHCVLDLEVK